MIKMQLKIMIFVHIKKIFLNQNKTKMYTQKYHHVGQRLVGSPHMLGRFSQGDAFLGSYERSPVALRHFVCTKQESESYRLSKSYGNLIS